MDDPEPTCNPKDVAVHRESRNTEGVPKDDIRRLSSNARQPDKVIHSGRHGSGVAVYYGRSHPDQRPGLGSEESRWLDEALQFFWFGSGQSRRIRVAREQRGGDGVDPLIRTLSGENRRDQELVRVFEHELRKGSGMLPPES